jgi:pSer/pThr/pTyr-binding forkhead associated (FHA) protein
MEARVVVSLDGEIVMESRLAKPVTVVGRHPACDIVIDAPHVSARHMLFRVVDRTVYVEDLASTNGTIVNGIPASHQVVHHLDLIEVGRHKLHFFDDALLSGGVSNLESTVVTEYERTMLAAHVAVADAAPAKAAPARADDDLDRTRMIRAYNPDGEPPLEQSRPGVKGPPLALRVVAGEGRGKVIALDKPNTMIGTAGTDTALVVKRAGRLLIARLGGQRPLRLNRRELGPGAHPIQEQDVIDVGSASFEVVAAAT